MMWLCWLQRQMLCLKFEFQMATSKIEVFRFPVSAVLAVSLADTAKRAEEGKLQFWSWPSEILNLKSSNINETLFVDLLWPHSTLISKLLKPLNTYTYIFVFFQRQWNNNPNFEIPTIQ